MFDIFDKDVLVVFGFEECVISVFDFDFYVFDVDCIEVYVKKN